jgi:hypothetical protein
LASDLAQSASDNYDTVGKVVNVFSFHGYCHF